MSIKGIVLRVLRWIWSNIYRICAVVIAVTLVVMCVDIREFTYSIERTIGRTWGTDDYFRIDVSGVFVPDCSYELEHIENEIETGWYNINKRLSEIGDTIESIDKGLNPPVDVGLNKNPFLY